MVTVILAMASITWLFGKNRALIQLLDNCEQQDATHVDNIFDLQQLNANSVSYTHLTLPTTPYV